MATVVRTVNPLADASTTAGIAHRGASARKQPRVSALPSSALLAFRPALRLDLNALEVRRWRDASDSVNPAAVGAVGRLIYNAFPPTPVWSILANFK